MAEGTGELKMLIWADPDKKIPLQRINFGKVEVGHEKTITVYLENDSKAVLSNLVYEFPNLPPTEILEVRGPVTIQPGKVEPLVLKWRPSPHFKRALVLDLVIRGEEIYLAEEAIAKEVTK